MDRPASYYVTADWQRFVPEGDPAARYGVAPDDIDRLGLRPALDAFMDAGRSSPRPADKRRRFPRTPDKED